MTRFGHKLNYVINTIVKRAPELSLLIPIHGSSVTAHSREKKVDDFSFHRSVRVAERLALPTSDHGVAGSNPAGGEILPEPKRRFIAQSLSCSPFHRLEMTEILLKGRKTLTHPSISFHIHSAKVLIGHLKFSVF